jgi:hypothetical protein
MEGHAKPSHSFTINLDDGRLAEVEFVVDGKKSFRTAAGVVPVVAVTASRKWLAGFTSSELAERDPNEPSEHFFSAMTRG